MFSRRRVKRFVAIALFAGLGIASTGCMSGRSHLIPEHNGRAMLEYYLPTSEIEITLTASDNDRTDGSLNLSARIVNRADPDARLFFQHDFNAFSSNAYSLTIAPTGLLSTAYVRSEGAVEQVLGALGQGSDLSVSLPEADGLPADEESVSAFGRPGSSTSWAATSIRPASITDLGSVRCAATSLLADGCVLETHIVLASSAKKTDAATSVRVCHAFDPTCSATIRSSGSAENSAERATTTHRIQARVRIDLTRDREAANRLGQALCSSSRASACHFSLEQFDPRLGSRDGESLLGEPEVTARQQDRASIQATHNCTSRLPLTSGRVRWERSCSSFVFYRSHLPVPVVLEAYYPRLGCPSDDTNCWQPIGHGIAHIARQDEVLAIDHRSAPIGSNALGLQFHQGRLVRFGTDQPAFAGTVIASPFAIANAVLEVPQNLFDFSSSDSDSGDSSN